MPWVNRVRYTDMAEADMENNVSMIYSILAGLGWTVNAVSGFCGCVQGESRFDPWAWQGNKIQPTSIMLQANPRGRAYGLIQWDSCNNYLLSPVAQEAYGYAPNFSDRMGGQDDGNAQLTLVNTGEGYYRTTNYPERFNEYKESTKGADYLAAAWLYNRQRPASTGSAATEAKVRERGLRWYEFLSGATPPDPDTYIITAGAYPASGGVVTGGGSVPKGGAVTLTATANSGYTFIAFKRGGALHSQNPYTYTPTASEVVLAIFNGGGGGDKPLPTPITRGHKMPIPMYLRNSNKLRKGGR